MLAEANDILITNLDESQIATVNRMIIYLEDKIWICKQHYNKLNQDIESLNEELNPTTIIGKLKAWWIF